MGTAESDPGTVGAQVPVTPRVAHDIFGDRIDAAEHYVRLLAGSGTDHGLIGPRETPRLWTRHVLNCAIIEPLLPERLETGHDLGPDDGAEGAGIEGVSSNGVGSNRAESDAAGSNGAEPGARSVIDVGSGAGLPGIPLAILRSDLTFHLVEPLSRRTAWLQSVVKELALTNVVVHTARAEDLWGRVEAAVVTARAVSSLENLAAWTLPLVAAPGVVLALKGARADEELAEAHRALREVGVSSARVLTLGEAELGEPTRVVQLRVERSVSAASLRGRAPTSAGSARRRAARSSGRAGRGSGDGAADRSADRSPGRPSNRSARGRRGGTGR